MNPTREVPTPTDNAWMSAMMSERLNPADFPGLAGPPPHALVGPATRAPEPHEFGDVLSATLRMPELVSLNALFAQLGVAPEQVIMRALAPPSPALALSEPSNEPGPRLLNRSRSYSGIPSEQRGREDGRTAGVAHQPAHSPVEEALVLVLRLAAMMLALQIIQLQKGRAAHPDGPPPYNHPTSSHTVSDGPSASTAAQNEPATVTQNEPAAATQNEPATATHDEPAQAVPSVSLSADPAPKRQNRIRHTPAIYHDAAAREAYYRARNEGAKEYDAEHGLDTIMGRLASWWAHVLP